MEKYIPVNCNFYDELEAWCTLRTTCDIIYEDESGAELNYTGKIADLVQQNKMEFIKLESGELIRLDRLKSVNGKIPSMYC